VLAQTRDSDFVRQLLFDARPLSRLTSLTSLCLSHCAIADVNFLPVLPRLRTLDLRHVTKLARKKNRAAVLKKLTGVAVQF